MKQKNNEDSKRETKGQYLKRIREEKGISLESVHEQTKIPMDALRAIEDGYKIRILSPFYIRGFLKIYAQYLDVDISHVIDDYEEERLPKTIKSKEEEFSYNISDFTQKISKHLTKQRKQQIVILIGIFIVLFVTFKILGGIISWFNHRPKPVHVEKVKKKSEPIRKEPVETVKKEDVKPIQNQAVQNAPVAPTQAVSNDPAPIVSSISKNVSVTVRARKDSWLRVQADGQVVFQSTLSRGSVETWLADDKVEISGRNISDLELEINGKMVALGRQERRATKVLITKDGLKVSD